MLENKFILCDVLAEQSVKKWLIRNQVQPSLPSYYRERIILNLLTILNILSIIALKPKKGLSVKIQLTKLLGGV